MPQVTPPRTPLVPPGVGRKRSERVDLGDVRPGEWIIVRGRKGKFVAYTAEGGGYRVRVEGREVMAATRSVLRLLAPEEVNLSTWRE